MSPQLQNFGEIKPFFFLVAIFANNIDNKTIIFWDIASRK